MSMNCLSKQISNQKRSFKLTKKIRKVNHKKMGNLFNRKKIRHKLKNRWKFAF